MRMSRSFSLALCATLVGVSASAQTAAPAREAATVKGGDTTVSVVDLVPKQGAQLQLLLKGEFAKAVAGGRTPFVELGATWCGPCNRLKASLGDKRMIDAFASTYIIRLDVDQWGGMTGGQLGALGFKSDGIPAFFPIDTAGKAIGPVITGGAWGDDIPENMAPPLKKFFHENLRAKKS